MPISLLLSILLATTPADPYAKALALYSAGDMTAAAKAFESAIAAGVNPVASRYNAACAHARAGNKDAALTHLEKLAASGYVNAPAVAIDADFASLKTEPRFQAVLQRMNANVVRCKDDPDARQLDFWLGEWEVRNKSGQPVGRSTIASDLDQCVITEHWLAG